MSSAHHLAAIMFADIVGYTDLMQHDETSAINKLHRFKEELKLKTLQYNGEIVQYYGDGCLLTFSNTGDAVTCAKVLQEDFRVLDIQVRIGIHLGDFLIEDGNIFGDSVNISSRIEGMGVPGSVLVSDSIKQQIKNKPEFKLTSLGKFEFKNVDDAIEIFALSNYGFPVPDKMELIGKFKALKPATTVSQLPDKKNKLKRSLRILILCAAIGLAIAGSYLFLGLNNKKENIGLPPNNASRAKSIAVLPFKLIGSDPEGRYFSEGVADALINHLNGIENLNVRSRTSVDTYKDSKKTLTEIAEELKVDYILEGSAQKYKDDIKIIVQLINARTDDHLWQDDYNVKYDDIFKVQSEIAMKIVSQLNVKLAGTKKRRIEKIPTKNTEAWDLFLRGKDYMRTWWKHREVNNLNFAINFFKESIKKDTAFALAYTQLADAIQAKEPPGPYNIFIDTLIQKSIQLDPELPHNYDFRARYFTSHNNKKAFAVAMQNIEKAIQLDPDNQGFLITKAQIFRKQIRHLEALAIYKQALEKEQSEQYNDLVYSISRSYYCVGEFELAEIYIRKALEMEPDDLQFLQGLAHIQMITGKNEAFLKTVNTMLSIKHDNLGLMGQGKAYLLLGDYANSEKAYVQLFALSKEKYIFYEQEKSAYAQVLRKLGKETEAMKAISEAKEIIEKMNNPNYDFAKVYSFLGEKQKALKYLKNWKPDWGVQVWVEKDPLFENIRNESEFKQLVQKFKSQIEDLRKQAQVKIANGEFPTREMIGK